MHFRFRSKPSKMRGNGAASTDPFRIVSWRFFARASGTQRARRRPREGLSEGRAFGRQFDEAKFGKSGKRGGHRGGQSGAGARKSPRPGRDRGRGNSGSHSGRAAALRNGRSGQWSGRCGGVDCPFARRRGDQGGDRVFARRGRRHARAGRRLQRHPAVQRRRAVSGGGGPGESRAQSAAAFGHAGWHWRDTRAAAHHPRQCALRRKCWVAPERADFRRYSRTGEPRPHSARCNLCDQPAHDFRRRQSERAFRRRLCFPEWRRRDRGCGRQGLRLSDRLRRSPGIFQPDLRPSRGSDNRSTGSFCPERGSQRRDAV